MKRILLALLSIGSISQCCAQELQATLYFRDGTSVEGFGELYLNNKIKFRTSLDEKQEIWSDLMVDAIEFEWYAGSSLYTFIDPTNRLKYELVEVLSEGAVNLYAKRKKITNTSWGAFNNGPPNTNNNTSFMHITSGSARTKSEVVHYYVQKEGSSNFEKVKKNQFRKFARNYFSICPDLHERLIAREFRDKSFRNIVDYYNDACIE